MNTRIGGRGSRIAVALLMFWASSVVGQIPSQARKLYPVDDAVRDPSFFTFRSQLLQALQRRDTTYLYSVMAPQIKNSFGGDDSIAGFKRLWKIEQANSPVWEQLTQVLSMGGKLAGNTFTAGYVFSHWPDAIDAFEFVAITGQNVSVRSEPSATATRIASLSFDIVALKDWQDLSEEGRLTADTWAQLELGDGRNGWVYGRYVYSPVGYRAMFEKRYGRWLLVFLLAGD